VTKWGDIEWVDDDTIYERRWRQNVSSTGTVLTREKVMRTRSKKKNNQGNTIFEYLSENCIKHRSL